MAPRVGIREVKAMLQDRMGDLCSTLLPRGRREGRLWVAYNPVTNDGKKDPAFKIAIEGDAGAWKDWRSGDSGDSIDLVAYIERTDRAGALRWAKDWLGLRSMSESERAELGRRVAARGAQETKKAEERARWKIGKATQMFGEAGPIRKGSPADLYFHARHCPLSDVRHPSRKSLRFAPALEWWKGAVYEEARSAGGATGRRIKLKEGPKFPAIVSALRNVDGLLTGVHCTFLAPQEARSGEAATGTQELWGKAPVDAPKLMFGQAGGSVIRIADGEHGPLEEAKDKPGPLILTEGLENGVTAAIAVPEARVWAAASLSGMGSAPVHHPAIGAIIVAAENDDNDQARRQLEDVLDALDLAGKPVETMRSFIGNDLNDLARAMA